jgi:hypothetical protein
MDIFEIIVICKAKLTINIIYTYVPVHCCIYKSLSGILWSGDLLFYFLLNIL